MKKFTVLAKYSNFTNIFLIELAKILPKYSKVNKYGIKLKKIKNYFIRLFKI